MNSKEFAKYWEWMFKIYRDVLKKTRSVLSDTNAASDETLVKQCLLTSVSFRLPAESQFDRLIGFREWIRTSKKILSRQSYINDLSADSFSAVLSSNANQWQAVNDYIEYSAGERIALFLLKDHLLSGVKSKWSFLFVHSFFALGQAIRCVFSNDRSNRALLIREVVEITVLLSIIEERKIKHLYNFVPYEKDSNLISLLLRDRGVVTTLIPSAGPLRTHNRYMLGDEIIFSTPYHFEEQKVFQHTIRAKKITRWIPEKTNQYISRYLQPLATPSCVLGFYSHGSWIRELAGHSSDGLNIAEAEKQLMLDLQKFLKANPEYRLIIFAHPREKSDAMYAKTVEHYSQYFDMKTGGIQISGKDVKTALAFEQVDIALAAFSTILYERLFAGFKTLIGNYNIPDFPMNGSPLTNICFSNATQLEECIHEASGESTQVFFERCGLSEYTFTNVIHKIKA